MKRSSKNLLPALLLFAILFSALSIPVSAKSESVFRCLIVGFDNASSNTDVMAVLAYDRDRNRVSVCQIPRDTYYRFGGVQNKWNQLYPYLLSGKTSKSARNAAMDALRKSVSLALGCPLDAYLAVSIPAFERMIDRIGGVPISLPYDIRYRNAETGETVTLNRGDQILNGQLAARFVRYRVGYADGDLGRIDAQKLFLSALFAKVNNGFGIRMLTTVFGEMRQEMITDITLGEAIRFAVRFMRGYGESDIRYFTLPGKAVRQGAWYYAANRKSAAEAVGQWLLFGGSGEFDPESRLCGEGESPLASVYRQENIPYRVYSDGELRGLRIRMNP